MGMEKAVREQQWKRQNECNNGNGNLTVVIAIAMEWQSQ